MGEGTGGVVVLGGEGFELVVATEELELVGGVVIDAVAHVPVTEAVSETGNEVIDLGGPTAGAVGLPDIGHHAAGGGVDAVVRNDVAGEGGAGGGAIGVDDGCVGIEYGAAAAGGVE